MNKYVEFWNFFKEHEQEIYNNIMDDIDFYVTLIQNKLELIHPYLAFEISQKKEPKRELIISADGLIDVYDHVIHLYNKKPLLKYFDVIKFRQPEHNDEHKIELEGLTLSYDDIFFEYTKEQTSIFIKVFIKGYDLKDQRYSHIMFLLLDSLIGEEQVIKHIIVTDVLPYQNNQINIRELQLIL